MAFCTKCGKQLADGEVCSCTAPKAEPPVNNDATQPNAPKNTTKKGNRKFIAILAAIAVIAVAILIFVLTAKPYLKPVKKFMAQINRQNTNYIELYKTLMPDFAADGLTKVYKKVAKSDDIIETMENSIENYESYYEDATDRYGKWELTFELKKAEKIDADEFEDIKDAVEDYYDVNLKSFVKYHEAILEDDDDLEDWADDRDMSEKEAKAAIQEMIKYYKSYKDAEATDGYEVKGKLVIKAEDETLESNTIKFIMAKINGDWTYYSNISNDELFFDSDDYDCFFFITNFLRSGRMFFIPQM